MLKKHISSRKIITVLLVLLSIVLIVVLPFVIYGNETTAENVSYFAQIVSSIFVIASVIIAVWQYYITSRSEICKLQMDTIRKAIDLAEYYKDNVLTVSLKIKLTYQNTGIMDILDKVKPSDMKNFDYAELEKLFSSNDIEELRKRSSPIKPMNSIDNYILSEEKNIKEVTDYVHNLVVLNSMQVELLNNLEYFAMNFTHNTADESVVFHSLAPTYLEIVRTMYYQIAKMNLGKENKYYTNVIKLYNIWNNKTTMIIEAENEHNSSKYNCGTVIDKNL